MADAKLEIKVGTISFTGEGAENWLSQQLDKVLTKLPELLKVHPVDEDEVVHGKKDAAKSDATSHSSTKKGITLAAFLKEKKATSNQARKFLATALWLHDTKGVKRVATADVTKTLNEHNQGKLTNPGQCLINNNKQGMVVRDGKEFYVTDEGRAELDK